MHLFLKPLLQSIDLGESFGKLIFDQLRVLEVIYDFFVEQQVVDLFS